MDRTEVAETLPHAGAPDRAFTHHEHQECLIALDRLHDAARVVGNVGIADLTLVLSDIVDWLETVVLPHAVWEDAWVFQEIDRRAGMPWATRLMRAEHDQIRTLARQLRTDRERLADRPREGDPVGLRGRLFGLEAVLRNHIEREERFLMLLLDALPSGSV